MNSTYKRLGPIYKSIVALLRHCIYNVATGPRCGAPVKPGADERGDHLFVIGKIVVEEPRGGDEEDASEE